MQDARGTIWLRHAPGALLALCLPFAPLAAAPGSVADYRLPPGPGAAVRAPQGPTDSDAPVVRPAARPADASEPPIAAPPPALPDAPADAQAQPRPSEGRTAPSVPAAAERREASRDAVVAVPVVTASQAATQIIAPGTDGSGAPAPAITVSEPIPLPWRDYAPWAGGGVLLLAAGWLLLRRSRRAPAVTDDRPAPDAAFPAPVAEVPALAPPAPVARLRGLDALGIELDAHQFSRTLVYATLAYRLTLANRGAEPLGPIAIAADLTSAHASLPSALQLAPEAGSLMPQHALQTLAPGESVTLDGQLRLPVCEILPIANGAALMFVPLARFRIAQGAEARTRVFVVGEPGEASGGALRPFRIDGMPGTVRDVSQREIELAA